MEITESYLRAKIAEMQATITAYSGAIEFANHLLEVLASQDTSMTVDEFAEAVAGAGATAEMDTGPG